VEGREAWREREYESWHSNSREAGVVGVGMPGVVVCVVVVLGRGWHGGRH